MSPELMYTCVCVRACVMSQVNQEDVMNVIADDTYVMNVCVWQMLTPCHSSLLKAAMCL